MAVRTEHSPPAETPGTAATPKPASSAPLSAHTRTALEQLHARRENLAAMAVELLEDMTGALRYVETTITDVHQRLTMATLTEKDPRTRSDLIGLAARYAGALHTARDIPARLTDLATVLSAGNTEAEQAMARAVEQRGYTASSPITSSSTPAET